ncbi:MAG: RsmE family RNA methyltransferase [Candidatus Sumerlaeia bacterium]|nr:RsmE family RNA methyltransferase [Candidatus Sumerlaeia bacterium]
MRRLRAFASVLPGEGMRFELDAEESKHLAQVLRVAPGQALDVVDGEGSIAECVVEESWKRGVALRVERLRRPGAPPPPLVLGVGLTKSDAFEDLIQRAVELGATAFVPLACDHSVVRLDAKREASRLERWRRIALAGLKQCERLWGMEVAEPESLEQFAGRGEGALLALVERADGTPDAGRTIAAAAPGPLRFCVGPEGGWSASERALLAARAQPVSLGAAVLRTETAALAALAAAALYRCSTLAQAPASPPDKAVRHED